MLLPPINFSTSMSLVPLFAWEPVPPPPPPPVDCGETAAEKAAEQTDDMPPEMRLVFKGFAWCPSLHIQDMIEPSWMRGFASSAETALEAQSRHEDDERARKQSAANAARLKGVHDTQAEPDLAPQDRTERD